MNKTGMHYLLIHSVMLCYVVVDDWLTSTLVRNFNESPETQIFFDPGK